ncbi:hypothetical protein PFISCL1PPCAC_25309, partial [Pristionchus fissidentatus]
VGNGTAKVLVMGNSFAYRAFPTLHKLFAGRYSKMRLYAKSGRVFLTDDKDDLRFARMQRIIVEKFQPDITFLIEKDVFLTLLEPIAGAIEKDPITKHLQASVDVLSNNSGTVVVDRQFYMPNIPPQYLKYHPDVKKRYNESITESIVRRVKQGAGLGDFEDLSVSKKKFESDFV